jgi:hypothetical protein
MLTWRDYIDAFVFAISATFLCVLASAGIVGSIAYAAYLLLRS